MVYTLIFIIEKIHTIICIILCIYMVANTRSAGKHIQGENNIFKLMLFLGTYIPRNRILIKISIHNIK